MFRESRLFSERMHTSRENTLQRSVTAPGRPYSPTPYTPSASPQPSSHTRVHAASSSNIKDGLDDIPLDVFDMAPSAAASQSPQPGAPNAAALQPPNYATPNTDLENGHRLVPNRTAQKWADRMWYLGHVMSLGTLLARYNIYLGVTLGVSGQALTIASRPIGRLQQIERGHSDDTH